MNTRADSVIGLAKVLFPFLMGVAGVLLLALPVRLFGGAMPMPIIPLAVIFFWSLYDPLKLPASSVFVIGLFQDALTGGPFGLWSCVYLMVQYVVLSQRSYFLGREPQVVWLGFILVAVGAAISVWLVMSLLAGYLLPLWGLSYQIIATICFYPVMGQGFRKIRRRVMQEM